MSSYTDLLGDGISHLALLGVASSSSQLLREGVLMSVNTTGIKLLQGLTENTKGKRQPSRKQYNATSMQFFWCTKIHQQ